MTHCTISTSVNFLLVTIGTDRSQDLLVFDNGEFSLFAVGSVFVRDKCMDEGPDLRSCRATESKRHFQAYPTLMLPRSLGFQCRVAGCATTRASAKRNVTGYIGYLGQNNVTVNGIGFGCPM